MESHKIIHSGQKIFKCTNCPSSFFRLDFQLIVKLNFVGPVACTVDISLKSQFRQTDLNKHEKIHQEREKTFFCQFCKAGFFKKSYLKIHEQRYGPRPTILETTYPNARHQAVVPVSDFGTSWAIDAIGNACILN